MRSKMEQLETRLQDSEHEVSRQLLIKPFKVYSWPKGIASPRRSSQIWSSICDPSAWQSLYLDIFKFPFPPSDSFSTINSSFTVIEMLM